MHPKSFARHLFALYVAVVVVILGCDSPSDTRIGPPAQLDIVSGNLQQATVGTALSNPLVARIEDASGNPIPNQVVNFRVVSGGGSVFAGSSQSNSQGLVQERWTLGTVADTQRVEVRAVDNSTGQPIVFATFVAVALPDAPAAIALVGTNPVTGTAGAALADSLAARVTDQYGNLVPNAVVHWAVVSGGGSVSPQSSNTNAGGIARTQWTLGPRVDSTQVAEARLSSTLAATYRATATLPAGVTLEKTSGDAQVATVAQQLPQPLVVTVNLSDGRPVAGAQVNWSATSGTLQQASTLTDNAGRATANWTLPTTAGVPTVTVSVEGAAPAIFSATARPAAPSAITRVAGNDQTATTGTTLPTPLAARVTDAYGNRVPGVWVRWSTTSGGSFAPDSSQTDATGLAQSVFTLPSNYSGLVTATAAVASIPPATFAARSEAPITLSVFSPVGGSTQPDDMLSISASATSDRPLTGLTAVVDGRQTSLVFSNNRWVGQIPLSGMSPGVKDLVVSATDVDGRTIRTTVPFMRDARPALSVTSPLASTVARPDIRITATCSDDDGNNPCTITARFGNTQIAQGSNQIDLTVSLAAHEGVRSLLTIVARDSGGQSVSVVRDLFVETSPRWTEIGSALTGCQGSTCQAWDFYDGRLLFVDSTASAAASVRTRVISSGTESTLYVLPSGHRAVGRGTLTDAGAIFMIRSGTTTTNLFETRNGMLINLGGIQPSSLTVKRPYALWNLATPDEILMRSDLVSGTVQVATNAGNWGNDVAVNGDAVYWTTEYEVFRYRSGNSTQLSNDGTAPLWNTYPITDGINVVYRKHGACCANQMFRIVLWDGTNEIPLTAPRNANIGDPIPEPIPKNDYAVNNGWVAFTEIGGSGFLQVFSRAADGTIRAVSPPGQTSRIVSLGPNGEIVYWVGNRRYLRTAPYTAAPVDIGAVWNHSGDDLIWLDNELVVLLGRSAFKISY